MQAVTGPGMTISGHVAHRYCCLRAACIRISLCAPVGIISVSGLIQVREHSYGKAQAVL